MIINQLWNFGIYLKFKGLLNSLLLFLRRLCIYVRIYVCMWRFFYVFRSFKPHFGWFLWCMYVCACANEHSFVQAVFWLSWNLARAVGETSKQKKREHLMHFNHQNSRRRKRKFVFDWKLFFFHIIKNKIK